MGPFAILFVLCLFLIRRVVVAPVLAQISIKPAILIEKNVTLLIISKYKERYNQQFLPYPHLIIEQAAYLPFNTHPLTLVPSLSQVTDIGS